MRLSRVARYKYKYEKCNADGQTGTRACTECGGVIIALYAVVSNRFDICTVLDVKSANEITIIKQLSTKMNDTSLF